jgi:deoxyribodipyrimidine photo-lyase
MQQSQRVEDNRALNFAINQANEMKLPIITLFVVTEQFPDANKRHYQFMLQGLMETSCTLADCGIEFVIVVGEVIQTVSDWAREAALLVTDKGYLKVQRSWRYDIAEKVACSFVEVESDTLFPVEALMSKEAYNAQVLRGKIYKALPDCILAPLPMVKSEYPLAEELLTELINLSSPHNSTVNFHMTEIETVLSKVISFDASVLASKYYTGGYSEAKQHLREFIDKILKQYFDCRSRPEQDYQSKLSPYLHFGQISIREVLSEIISALGISYSEFVEMVLDSKQESSRDRRVNGALAFFEEAIVRRELSMNFCHFNDDYDQYSALPNWARTTLSEHTDDFKMYTYDLEALELAKTHDDYWNAAQKEMVITGKMHGYMRMYWGKKIIEWSATPEQAWDIALYLNNKYELDGRDPNAFAGVAWCFGKHDRAWGTFPVFGTVRTMTKSGLNRKYNMQKYIKRIDAL